MEEIGPKYTEPWKHPECDVRYFSKTEKDFKYGCFEKYDNIYSGKERERCGLTGLEKVLKISALRLY